MAINFSVQPGQKEVKTSMYEKVEQCWWNGSSRNMH